MNSKKWLEEAMRSPVKRGLPILSFPCTSLMNITVRELIGDAQLMARGMKLVADRTKSAASVSMMDLSVEAEAFGAQVRFSDNEVPVVTGSLVSDEASLAAMREPRVGDGRTTTFIKSVEEACKLITDRPVFAGAIGPFTLCGRLMGVSETMIKCVAEPQLVSDTMKKANPFLIEYIKAMKDTGAAGLIMAEPLTGLLSPKLAKQLSEPFVKEIVDAVQDENFLIIYHNCGGAVPKMIDSVLATGAAGYHFGNAISMKDILARMPGDVAVMGNIDPSAYFCLGTPESMHEAALSLLRECCPEHPNFIISSGCDMAAQAKWENIDAFFNAIDEYNAESGAR